MGWAARYNASETGQQVKKFGKDIRRVKTLSAGIQSRHQLNAMLVKIPDPARRRGVEKLILKFRPDLKEAT